METSEAYPEDAACTGTGRRWGEAEGEAEGFVARLGGGGGGLLPAAFRSEEEEEFRTWRDGSNGLDGSFGFDDARARGLGVSAVSRSRVSLLGRLGDGEDDGEEVSRASCSNLERRVLTAGCATVSTPSDVGSDMEVDL